MTGVPTDQELDDVVVTATKPKKGPVPGSNIARVFRKPAFCSRPLYRLGVKIDNLGKVGKFVGTAGVAAGLGAAAVGGVATAPAGGEGAAPGLALASASARLYVLGALVSTGGNILKGLAGSHLAMAAVVSDIVTGVAAAGAISDIGSAITGNAADLATEPLAPKDPC